MVLLPLSMLLVGAAISAALCMALRATGTRRGWLDIAGEEAHKRHEHAVPNLGGVAITWAIALPAAVILLAVSFEPLREGLAQLPLLGETLEPHLPGLRDTVHIGAALLLAVILLHVIGLIDDRRPMNPWIKLAAQAVAAILLVGMGEFQILSLLSDWQPPWGVWAVGLLSVLWLVAITNAMNFLDNMDGLAGGVAAIIAGVLLGAALVGGQWFIGSLAGLLLGGLLGFLWFNLPPARLFMGDGGSLVVGLLLGALTMRLTYTELAAAPANETQAVTWSAYLMLLTPLVWLAIPLYDLIVVTAARLAHGRSPLRGDHNHLSHRLHRTGLSRPRAVATIYGLTTATCLAGSLLNAERLQVQYVGLMLALLTLGGLLVWDLRCQRFSFSH